MKRLNEINKWLKNILDGQNYTIEPASNDASFRRYFRITSDQQTWILMDAPPEKENTQPFIQVARFLFKHNINVPKIEAHDKTLGFILLSDFGSHVYLDKLNQQSADRLYGLAIDGVISMQQCPLQDIQLPLYDRTLLEQELNLFPQWFLQTHLDIATPDFLEGVFNNLIENALEQPQVFVHRDYHSRNLMDTDIQSPGIIDFQDAVIGPITYDLVSLLRDCYISWPEAKLEQWLQLYLTKMQANNQLQDISLAQFTRWFDLMGLQRHIKVLGIFCRLNYRDNKSDYINDLPLTLHYVKQISSKYSEFSELSDFLQQPKIMEI